MTDLNGIVEMLTDPGFIQNHWMQKPKVFQAAGLFERVRTEHSLETLIRAATKFMPDSIHLIEKRLSRRLTRDIDLSKCDDPEKTVLNIAQHRTLILYDFHIIHRFYRELALQLDEKFWGDTTAGMFVSLNKRSGFKKHRDRNHIFVFQHTGSTIWKVYDFMKERKLILEHELVPGEILYVPIFCGHSARRVGIGESHVSVGISYDRKRNFYETLVENPLLSQACEPEARQQLLKSREVEKQRNLIAMPGPKRTWICKSRKHETLIAPDSILAAAWAMQQENGKHGPLEYGDVSCNLCNPQVDPNFRSPDPA